MPWDFLRWRCMTFALRFLLRAWNLEVFLKKNPAPLSLGVLYGKVDVSLLEVYLLFFWWDDKVSGSFFCFFGNFDAHFFVDQKGVFSGCVLRMRVCRWSAPSSWSGICGVPSWSLLLRRGLMDRKASIGWFGAGFLVSFEEIIYVHATYCLKLFDRYEYNPL